jgi:hypothetical protein
MVLLSLLLVRAYDNPSAARALMMEMMDYNTPPEEDNVESPQCNVNADGFYGSNGVSETLIEFKYQLEYTAGSSLDDILFALERAVADKVLPTLFGGECERRHQLRRRLTTVGASINPADMKLPCELYLLYIPLADSNFTSYLRSFVSLLVDCTIELKSNTSSCAVIDGQMTVYTDDGAFNQTDTVLKEIEQAMNGGDFNNGIHPEIVNVFYLDQSTDSIEDGADGPGAQNTPMNNGFSTPFIVAIAVGGLAVIIAGVVWSRRKDKDTASVVTDDTPLTGTAGAVLTPEALSAQNNGALDFTPI